MIRLKFLYIIIGFVLLVSLNSCGLYKRSDVKDNPVNVDERVRKNIYVKKFLCIADVKIHILNYFNPI